MAPCDDESPKSCHSMWCRNPWCACLNDFSVDWAPVSQTRHRVRVSAESTVKRLTAAFLAPELAASGSSALLGYGSPSSSTDRSLRGKSTYDEPNDVLPAR